MQRLDERTTTQKLGTMSEKRLPLLQVQGVGVRFGGVVALGEVSFDVAHGSIVGLIGPNGAGKTTLFNCLSRLYQPTGGDILLEGKSILGNAAYEMASTGVGRTFQSPSLFESLSVLDNLRVGGHARANGTVIEDILKLGRSRESQRRTDAQAEHVLEYLGLREVANRRAGELPFGTRKRVEIGRALTGLPKLLLLDEPACGLNSEEVLELSDLIGRIRADYDAAVLLVEHNVGMVMSLSDRVVALNFGRVIADGTPAEVQAHEGVVAAYLGLKPAP